MFVKPGKCVGVGINFRNEISADIIKNIHKLDFIEINTERFFMAESSGSISVIINRMPVVLHGLTLSIGTSKQKISKNYFENLEKTLKKVDCLWFSEHIAITNVGEIEIRGLAPVEFTLEGIDVIVEKVRQIKAISKKQFLLENIAYYYAMPTSYLEESLFIKKIVEIADCGILLDLNNLYVNAINHKYDPYEFIDQLPLDRVVEVHLAGCDYIHGMLIDTHASSIKNEVLSLFEYLCKKTFINGVVIERDDRLKHFSDLLSEVEFVRNILRENKIINH